MDDCLKAAPLISIAIAAPLDTRDHDFLDAHLARCEVCTGALAALLGDDLPALPATPARSTAMPQPSIATPRFIRPALLAAALAAAVLLIVIAFPRDAPKGTIAVEPSAAPVRTARCTPKQRGFATWCEDAAGRKQGAYDVIVDGVVRQHREYRDDRPHGRWTLFGVFTPKGIYDFVAGELTTVDQQRVKPDFRVRAAERAIAMFRDEERKLDREDPAHRRIIAAMQVVKADFAACMQRLPANVDTLLELDVRVTRGGQVSEATAKVDGKLRDLGDCVAAAARKGHTTAGDEVRATIPLQIRTK